MICICDNVCGVVVLMCGEAVLCVCVVVFVFKFVFVVVHAMHATRYLYHARGGPVTRRRMEGEEKR